MTSDEPRGTSRAWLLAQLDARAPELATQVRNGELSTYRASVRAGFVKARFSLFGHDPDVIAKAMRRNLPPDVLAAVVERLTARESK